MTHESYTLHDSLGYLVHRAVRALAARLSENFASAGLDVTVEQWKVLVNLYERDGQPQGELCERIGKDKTGVTRLVAGLVRRGLAVRMPGESDRRVRRVWLTDKAKSLRERLFATVVRTLEEAQAGIGGEALACCKDVLRRVAGNLAPRAGGD